jgi:DNA polymerase III epsilon subunit-like protein
MRYIMLDIETLGTKPGCIILSIGAVEFTGTEITKTFHVNIDVEDSSKFDMHIDARTVLWWLGQSKEAQDAILQAQVFGLEQALCEFEAAFDWNDVQVWCNGAAFDFPILSHAFNAVGKKTPWKYYDEMDMRTVKGLVGKDMWKKLQVKAKLAHDALEDAIAQAKTLQNYLGLRENGSQA